MKNIIIIVIIIITSGLGLTTRTFLKNKEIDYKTYGEEQKELTYEIDNNIGSNSRYSERGIYYDTLNTPNAPSYYIIAMGEKNTGGYSINVKKVNIYEDENVEIIVEEKTPDPGMSVTMVFTYPVCRVELSKEPKSIVVKNTTGGDL